MTVREAVSRTGRAVMSLPGRICISLALLASIALSLDWAGVEQALGDAEWQWFATAVVLAFVALLVGGARWHWLLSAARIPISLVAAVRVYFIGAFSNAALPTGFGGDLVRAWFAAPAGRPFARSLTSVLVDRATSLICFVALAWVGVVFESDGIPGSWLALLAIVSAVGVAGTAAVVMSVKRSGIARFLPARIRPSAAEAGDVVRDYLNDGSLLVRVLLLGFLFQGLMVLATWSLSEALGLDLALGLLAVVTPLALIATLLPISIAGFGIREGAFVALLADVGVPAEQATLLSLLSFAAVAAASLPGGIALLRAGQPEIPADT